MQRFSGRVALVSGGAGAIGTAIARRLAAEGARVVLGDLVAPAPDALGAAFAGLPLPGFVRLDVTDAASWAQATGEVAATRGALDVLVNNAGVVTNRPCPIDEIALDEWRRVFSVNVDGVLLGIQAGLRAMGGRPAGGAIVNMGSIAGFVGSEDGGAYGTSKAAVRNLTKQAALSAARRGLRVRVNAVHPGYVWTPLVADMLTRQHGGLEAAQDSVRARNPMRTIVTVEAVAAAVAFLASDDASTITGADLVVDAGRLIQ